MAMVAKQAWNFVLRPHTLVARIFKARWKIGDESKIKIMSEPWLRGEDNSRVQAPQAQSKRGPAVWQYENHGVYTVKSGYRNYLKRKAADSNNTKEGEWGALWRSCAPPKTKHLLWRVCHECLPTRIRLRERQVWNEAGMGEVIESRLRSTIAWCIWNNRNNWVWNGTKDTAKSIVLQATHMVGEWRAINLLHQQKCSNATVTTHVCDTAATVRGTNISMHELTIVEGEAMTILHAMREAVSRGWTNIMFESDSTIVVDAIHSNCQGLSELSSIIAAIRLLLQCNSNFEIKFTKRQANMAAHTLARAAISWWHVL
ncbi:hypothetical protein TSUD_108550 [Trifolium subterraneum]|nr:hypothetical protein TSUD_108550 [Trifolium subterraneum]